MAKTVKLNMEAPLKIKITHLARGLASGTTIEYADETTLANAFKNRR